MIFSFRTCLFFLCLLLGVLLRVSSDSWFGAWFGLELNLMSFIPLICSKSNKYSSEASLKYFLVQALGSSFVILGTIELIIFLRSICIICIALILKLGASPIHFWFPQVIEGLGWLECFILITVQKIGPIYLLSYLLESKERAYIVYWVAIISAVVGALGGINQLLLRKLLAYSSINHISWLLFAIMLGENCWGLYFIIYSIIVITVVIIFSSRQCFHFSQLISFRGSSWGLIRGVSLLSLGGLPPFTGFIPKWVVIQEMVSQSLFFPLLFLLRISLVTLYYYLRVIVIFIVLNYPIIKWNIMFLYSFGALGFGVGFNLLGLALPSVFILI